MRVDKFLADRNIGTRSEIKQYVKKGLVSVNDAIIKDSGISVNPEVDVIKYQGKVYSMNSIGYFMLNKPSGIVSATKDNFDTTVLDLLHEPLYKGLFPVGRLDKDTTGLLLISNDGALAHKLLSPTHHVEKTYLVDLLAPLTEKDIQILTTGVDIGDDTLTRPAKIVMTNLETQILLTIKEGRFHQIKRMLHAVQNEVTALQRISMGPITLDSSLNPGEYRPLTEIEIQQLLNL